jgi:hypothetical protein
MAHFLGDFIFQNDFMAAGKKKSNWICLLHIVTYLIPFLFCGLAPWQLILIGIEHYAQDRTNFVVWFMNLKGSKLFAQPPMAPWSIIVTDNILHIIFILWIVGGK